MLPNFLIIGAARSGTTTLYTHLQAHPQVYVPKNKRPEPHFFFRDSEYAKGITYYEQKYFSDTGNKTAIGEASTSYLFGETVPKRIKTHLPRVRLIAMLRSPADRAFSNYWHTVASGLETMRFEEAVEAELQGTRVIADSKLLEVRPFEYIGRSRYAAQIRRYLEHFGSEQLLIIRFEDFIGQPAATLRKVFRFLEVDEDFSPADIWARLNSSVPEDKKLSPALRKRLNSVFEKDVQDLSSMLKCDFSEWLNSN